MTEESIGARIIVRWNKTYSGQFTLQYASASKDITGNLEKEYLDDIDDLAGKKIDILQLYGTRGVGEVAKYAYVGQAIATPNDVGGADEILEMTVTVIPNTAAKKVTDEYTVTDNGDGTFTVEKV